MGGGSAHVEPSAVADPAARACGRPRRRRRGRPRAGRRHHPRPRRRCKAEVRRSTYFAGARAGAASEADRDPHRRRQLLMLRPAQAASAPTVHGPGRGHVHPRAHRAAPVHAGPGRRRPAHRRRRGRARRHRRPAAGRAARFIGFGSKEVQRDRRAGRGRAGRGRRRLHVGAGAGGVYGLKVGVRPLLAARRRRAGRGRRGRRRRRRRRRRHRRRVGVRGLRPPVDGPARRAGRR